MESVVVTQRNHTNKKGNKENTLRAHGPKSFIRGDKTSVVPFQLKGNKKDTTTKQQSLTVKSKQVDSKPVLGDALRKVKTAKRDGKAAAADVQRPTNSQEQAAKIKKAAASKSLAAVPPSKSAPGMYRGRVIQSKIGSLWKSSNAAGTADPKPSAPRSESQRVGNMAKKNRSQSVADVAGHSVKRPAPIRSKSVSDKPGQVIKAGASNSRPAGFFSSRPPTRTFSATVTSARSRNTTEAPNKSSGNQNTKPKIPVTDKVNNGAVSSTLSQYRFSMETAEERRGKLAEWLASKGKTLKRPAMTTAAPSNKVPAKAKVEVRSNVEPLPAADPGLQVRDLRPNVAACHEEVTTHSQTPEVMNTTLDLLENSDGDLSPDLQDRVDDIVVNLCDALEALVTPSRCSDNELKQVKEECDNEEYNKPEECDKELKNEGTESEEVKNEEEESAQGVVEEVESGDDDVMETTPEKMKDASIIKYSVKTTPYLQSVKKTIEDEVGTNTSKKKSNIKDLKFLTPVRRSCRIQRKSSRLPSMLADHDPCVSSLAELVQLDDDANAYIYRKNPALLQELPDQD
ncbi:cytoskeleton-associated protein 2 isoform X1 [Kryptolebias marmoratus]|uniref:cytoskeleton-associated protein 2 isoform X1 n=1 Tax=Kryptolebias marmoratus TaxID=37003 RepID=UPI0007F8FA6D|nr:cytoskeleton-associated protein 2 isoform X1 [Kryptolebias marmoratus]